MKIYLILAIVAIALSTATMSIGSLTNGIQMVNADPSEPHGTCGVGGDSGKGAFGCAGNVGGFINTPNGKCHTTGGPFNTFSCP